MNIGINAKHLLDLIINPTLNYLKKDSDSARLLVLCTCAVESRLGHYLKQKGNGPALGIYQMEPKTHTDLYENVLADNPILLRKVNILSKHSKYWNREHELIANLEYATAMARIQYWRFKEPLPEYGDIAGMGAYWKKYYNTTLGDGTIKEFVRVYQKYIEGQI